MKTAVLLSFVITSQFLVAQPIIQDGLNFATVGTTYPIYLGTSLTGVGSAGANQTWNLSSLTVQNVGTQTYIDPSTTPYAANYNQGNRGFKFDLLNGSVLYHYYIESASQFEQLATNISTGPGSGSDYSPNPTTILRFPFAFNDTYTDTYQKVGYSQDNVTLTYDGYGTLQLPQGTYTNVVRIKYAYNSGNDYAFWSVNPLRPILIYNYDNNQVIIFSETGIGQDEEQISELAFYPNPATDQLFFSSNGITASVVEIEIFDLSGKKLAMLFKGPFPSDESVVLNISNYPPGTYFLKTRIANNEKWEKLTIQP